MKKGLVVILSVLLVITVLSVSVVPLQASAATEFTDVIVKVGQQGADMYEQSLNGVLYTVEQIGFMADRILWTEEQIGVMADRIVYVTEISQNNAIKVIYIATTLWPVGERDGGYLYEVFLMPIAVLPAGW